MLQFLKWVVVSSVIGIAVGMVGTAFSYGIKAVDRTADEESAHE